MIKSVEISEIAIQKTHCDYIVERVTELKSLLSYNDGQIIPYNKTRTLSSIECMMQSLEELKNFIEEF